MQTETTAGIRLWRILATDPEFLFTIPLRKAAAQQEERPRGVQPVVARGPFLGPTGPAARVRAPKIPEGDCAGESGHQSRHWWAQIELGHGGPGLVHGWLFRWGLGPEPWWYAMMNGLGWTTSAKSG